MKSYKIWASVLSLCVGLFAASCSDDGTEEPQIVTPEIAISEVIPDVESVTFTLTTKDATAYEYGCVPTSEFESGAIVEMTREEGAAPADPIKIEGLTASTAYTIVARAYNGEVRSETVNEATTTLAAASEAPVLTLSEPVVDGQSVTFKITHTGDCASYNYAVYEKSAGLPENFKTVAAKEEGVEVEVRGLEGETAYVIEAYGTIGDITGEHVKDEFTTEAPALDVAISEVSSQDARIRTTMEEGVCASYYLGGFPMSNALTNEEILEMIAAETSDIHHTNDMDDLLSNLQIDGLTGGLEPETTYIVWWIACDADPDNDKEESAKLSASQIQKTSFTTKELDLTSTATVNISVEAISTSTASVKFTPSSDAVQYYYVAIPTADVEKLYFNDKLLANHLILMKPAQTAEQTIAFNSLKSETSYTFCAIAEDKDGKFGVPVKVVESTKGFEFDSSVVFELKQMELKNDPQENAQFSIEGDLTDAQEIRYMNITRADYSSQTYFGGKDENVLNALLTNGYPTIAVLPDELTRGRLDKFTQLDPAENYYCFAIILDKEGKFTPMQKVAYKTASYDQEGTATATWEISEEKQAVDGNNRLMAATDYKLKITPNADCVESWVYIVHKEAYEAQPTKELIRQAKTQDAGWHSQGATPWITETKTVYDNYMLLVVCKDKDGKYNDIRRDAKPIENKYSNYEKPENPDEGGGSPKGNN